MIEQPSDKTVLASTDERDPLDLVAEEFAERCRRGEQPSVSEYLTRYPQWADELRELLPAAAMMEELRRHKRGACAVADHEALERLGDYRIVREIGRGGMGIVYEAVQESLGRHVALKVLPRHSLLDPKKLARFQREAQAAAALHHSNIVPVFGVGEHEGLHYYVMQLIPGQGLHEVLAQMRQQGRDRNGTEAESAPLRSRLSVREVARLGVQVADALDYAHNHGTLHRDVKPANILLDSQGTVWLTDFGLAKLAEQNNLTSTGDLVGTLQYLAPESLNSQTDARSDVYSLGLTLYELLTLAPPFPESNPARLLQQVSMREPARPRKLNPAIPRDLETVILKAIAREPAHRYQTACELADDLRCFLDDRPIRARRLRVDERLLRWYRHNRVVAGLLAALVLVFLTGFIGVTWKWREAENALQREAEQRRIAEKATERAESNVRLSLQAFEEIFNDLAARESAPPFGRPPFREEGKEAALLQDVLQFYDDFAKENETNSRVQVEAAKAHRRVGDIHLRRGDADKASSSYARATAILDTLLAAFPAQRTYRYELVETLTRTDPHAVPADAEKRLRRAAALIDETIKDPTDFPRFTLLAGRVQARMAAFLEKQDRKKEAEQTYRRAAALLKSLDPQLFRPPSAVIELNHVREGLATLLLDQDRTIEARAVAEEWLNDLQKPSRHIPLAHARKAHLKNLADIFRRLHDPKRAAEVERMERDRPGPSSRRSP
ncbi:MAG TPA: serine/threonine-protein kinase [Gemmataceae bacterium]|nr:serine/threonine-protein kinase [Gemmataceae bacterium]